MTIKKTYTDNPFMDTLLYCVKLLAYGSVVKISSSADNAETSSSISESDLYIASMENRGIFDLFTYTRDILITTSLPTAHMASYINNKYNIPESYRDEVTKAAMTWYINHYEEKNEYYRKICGLPPIGDYGIPIRDYEYLIPDGNDYDATYVHELGADGAQMLDSYGILDIIKADYPDADYLDYITCGITPYKARKAFEYQILYSPSTSVVEIDDKFVDKYEENRTFVMRTMYSDAMKLRSDYYDNFIGVIILIMTIVDMLTEVQEHIVKKDILDARCIQYIFSMYGIPYYTSIPMKYQIAMCKNVNKLIKYKSCKEGMLNIVSLFGMDDIKIFKYYILRDRQTDKYGEFIYNTTTNITSEENDIVLNQKETIPISNKTIPFPFEYFLSKGNVMFVWLDNYKLNEDTDYEIYDSNQIRFKNNVDSGKSNIIYDFYYDKSTIDTDYIDTANSISMSSLTFTNTDTYNKFTFTPPFTNYFVDGNSVIVSVGGLILPKTAYTITPNAYKFNLVINSAFLTKNRTVYMVFLYGKTLSTKFDKIDVVATTNNQTVFTIPEPFTNYLDNGNRFFITVGSLFIDPSRYTTNENQLTFTDLQVAKNRSVSFHFIYSSASVYTPITITTSTQTIIATNVYQYIFTLDFPIENYLTLGYKVYIKIGDNYISDDCFDVYGVTLRLRDMSLALQPGNELEVLYVHGPTNTNVFVSKDYRVATTQYQDTFSITYPISDFYNRDNKVLIDCEGAYLVEGTDFEFTNTGKTQFRINTSKYLPYEDQKVNYTFVYNKASEYAINFAYQEIIVETNNQTTFSLDFPFYPYTETGQGFLILHNSLLIRSDLITVNGYNCTLGLTGLKTGDQLMILYIFNNNYLLNRESILVVEEKTVSTSGMSTSSDKLYIDIPVPFSDYIENDWDWFVDSNRYSITDGYDAVNNQLLFLIPRNILKYSSITFTFVYKKSYLTITEEEDYSSNMKLKFVKIPLNATSDTPYLKNTANQKSYDSMTLPDRFWDGEDNQDNGHEDNKLKILKKEFNYARTKYMTIEYLVDLANMSFEISYFYNMLYDDVFKEDLLKVNVPTISANKKFKLSHLFCYMTALAYNFSGMEDSIMTTPTQVLYVKGFNFKADIASLKSYVLNNRRLLKDFDVWKFSIPGSQISTIEDFITIYKTNQDVWKSICYNMTNARNYDIYKIWKKLYDSLMIWKFNLQFFKLSSGDVASTFTEFLQEKDNVLYTSINTITSITDKETRENEIVSIISDTVYILEEYIDSNEFKYIYNQLPGVSKEYILQYLFTMINFFKSYKIILKQMNVQFIIDDPNTSSIKIYDKQKMQIHLRKPDYITITESKSSTVNLKKSETIGIREKVIITPYYIS